MIDLSIMEPLIESHDSETSTSSNRNHRLLNICCLIFIAQTIALFYHTMLVSDSLNCEEKWSIACGPLKDCDDVPIITRSHNDSLIFPRRQETAHVDCGRVLREDWEYISSIKADRPNLRRSRFHFNCEYIRNKVVTRNDYKEIPFGVAHVRIVYESYDFIEEELAASYHPQNVFCYSVDKKAPYYFNLQIEFLSSCFPNVFVSPVRFSVTSRGHYQNHAYHECLKLLVHIPGWEYLIRMQNYDIMLKSVYETVSIFQALHGRNDISVTDCDPRRWDHSAKWDLRSLNLYPEGSNVTLPDSNVTLKIACGVVQTSLSRAAVKWMVETVNLTTLLDQLNADGVYGTDEILMASLRATPELDMPGRNSSSCSNISKRRKYPSFFTRFTAWNKSKVPCLSQMIRHEICIFGIEDLSRLSSRYELLANKILPYFDYAVVDCLHELLFNRTHLGQIDHALDLKQYSRKCR
uniref:Glycosyltransferase family 92 protein n=1 Tax=Haemonchus contortus TaxID=6289 RepID=A0A7I5E8W6_HAECO